MPHLNDRAVRPSSVEAVVVGELSAQPGKLSLGVDLAKLAASILGVDATHVALLSEALRQTPV